MNDRKRNGEKEKEEVMVELGRTDGIGARESRKERVHSLSLSLSLNLVSEFLGAVESETRGN